METGMGKSFSIATKQTTTSSIETGFGSIWKITYFPKITSFLKNRFFLKRILLGLCQENNQIEVLLIEDKKIVSQIKNKKTPHKRGVFNI